MAKKIFKGFKQEIEGQFTAETGYLYFVRNEANTGKTDGYLLFNGKKYGTSAEAVEHLEALIGELPTGFSSVSEWIESNERVTAGALTDLDARVSANTEAIEAISGVTGDFATKTELGTLSGRVDTVESNLGVVSGRVDVLEASGATKEELGTLSGRVDTVESNLGVVSGRVDALSAVSADSRIAAIEADYLKSDDKTQLEGAIGTVSGRVDVLEVSAATKTELGALSGRVDALSAVSADSRIAAIEAVSADTRLNALENGVQLVASGDSSVNVSEISNGTQTVSVNISDASNNALSLDETNGGLFAAIYYDGDDSE